MRIAIEGCAHGELEKIYETISFLEEKNNFKVDLLLCCGDFQASRNYGDLDCMAVPPKFRHLCSFYKYYSGEKKAPILTIIIGGNHEASNYFQELAYGGWVAPNIYYLGYAGVVQVGGIRIGGLSGIFKSKDYYRGRFEKVPYSEDTKRSCYHVRVLDVFRLKQVSKPIHIMMSHDWPEGVYNHGNIDLLLKKKPFFRDEVTSNSLGSQPAAELLSTLRPNHWFSAHLHVKFPAVVKHDDGSETKFLALDKCLPRRQFLQIVSVPHEGDVSLSYDLEWLAILQLTDHLTSIRTSSSYMPGPGCGKRWKFSPTEEEKNAVKELVGDDWRIPYNFVQTAPPHDPSSSARPKPALRLNPQTTTFCALIGIDDPLALLLKQSHGGVEPSPNNSKHNYSSFQTSGDMDNIDSSWNTPVKHPVSAPRTPLQLPVPKIIDEPRSLSTPIQLPQPVSFSSPKVDYDSSASLISDTSIPCTPIPHQLSTPTPKVSSDTLASEPCATTSVEASENPEVNTNGDDLTNSPGPKRFRRRNLAMYASNTEQD